MRLVGHALSSVLQKVADFIKTLKNADQIYTYLMKLVLNAFTLSEKI